MTQTIDRQMLLNFVLNEVSEKNHKYILKKIDNDKIIRLRYLQLKRKIDVEKYLDNDMSVGERIEFEELLKNDKKLRVYFELSKDVNEFLSAMVNKKRRIR
ncbi:MAG: hypothetical protein GQ564_17305 [Bacteroidales bacterium]|nr:hypothetical protein [Bacteroidales bacterium]